MRYVRFARAQLVLSDDLDGHTVLSGADLEILQRLALLLRECKDERAVPLERHLQFLAHVLEHPVSENIELRLVRSGLGVKPSVHYRGVGLGRTFRDISARFKEKRTEIVSAEFARGKTPHHAATNDNHIILH